MKGILITAEMNEMYERNLPPYLANDLEAWKKGVEEQNAQTTERYKV